MLLFETSRSLNETRETKNRKLCLAYLCYFLPSRSIRCHYKRPMLVEIGLLMQMIIFSQGSPVQEKEMQ